MKWLVLLLLAAGCAKQPAGVPMICTQRHTETQVTYPYAALASLDSTYAALAATPLILNVEICDKWEVMK